MHKILIITLAFLHICPSSHAMEPNQSQFNQNLSAHIQLQSTREQLTQVNLLLQRHQEMLQTWNNIQISLATQNGWLLQAHMPTPRRAIHIKKKATKKKK